MKLLLSIKDSYERLSIGRSSLYALIAAGDIVTIKIGRRTLIRAETIESFIRAAENDRRHASAINRFEAGATSDDDSLGNAVTNLRKARSHGSS
jgi:excisionase family DNA binding protein